MLTHTPIHLHTQYLSLPPTHTFSLFFKIHFTLFTIDYTLQNTYEGTYICMHGMREEKSDSLSSDIKTYSQHTELISRKFYFLYILVYPFI